MKNNPISKKFRGQIVIPFSIYAESHLAAKKVLRQINRDVRHAANKHRVKGKHHVIANAASFHMLMERKLDVMPAEKAPVTGCY